MPALTLDKAMPLPIMDRERQFGDIYLYSDIGDIFGLSVTMGKNPRAFGTPYYTTYTICSSSIVFLNYKT